MAGKSKPCSFDATKYMVFFINSLIFFTPMGTLCSRGLWALPFVKPARYEFDAKKCVRYSCDVIKKAKDVTLRMQALINRIVYFLAILAIIGHFFISVNCELPNQIHVAAIFDQLGDRKHELAFKYGIEVVNRDRYVLPGIRIIPNIIRIPPGDR